MTTKYGYSIIDDVNFLIKYIPKIFEFSDKPLPNQKSRAGAVSNIDCDYIKRKEIDYEFFNHHVLRAAVSRVIGLVRIIELENKEWKQEEIFMKLQKSCEEIESVMNESSAILTTDIETS